MAGLVVGLVLEAGAAGLVEAAAAVVELYWFEYEVLVAAV